MFRKVYNAVAWMPMVWLALSWITIFLAYIKLGHLPVYGHDPDPTELGFEIISLIAALTLFLCFLMVFLWPFTVLTTYIIEDRKYKVDYISVSVFACSIVLIECFKSFFLAQFLWFND
jgi:hypothetical protein